VHIKVKGIKNIFLEKLSTVKSLPLGCPAGTGPPRVLFPQNLFHHIYTPMHSEDRQSAYDLRGSCWLFLKLTADLGIVHMALAL
jgi:hypothetical protein